ncbi:MAG: response regulator [Methanosarcinaceae archaeon]|nr:response regulator [Methanosarcinaceae archaeon]
MTDNTRSTILIVDDVKLNVDILADYLSAYDYGIITAFSGEEALEKVNNEHPDMILLDIMMPGMSGYEVCEILKTDERTQFIPIVMVTALSDREDRIKGLEAGADDFLTKPVDVVELRTRVRSLLRVKHLHDDILHRDAILEAVSFSADNLLRAPFLNNVIPLVLEKLGQASGVDRVYIFQNVTDGTGTLRMRPVHEWTAPDTLPLINQPKYQNLSYIDVGLGRWMDILGDYKVIASPVAELPAQERMVLEQQDTLSFAVAPIWVEGIWWGFIGFDDHTNERQWSAVEMDAIKTAADTLGGAIQRKQVEMQLRENEKKLTTILTSIQTGVLIIDAQTHTIIDANPAAVSMIGASNNEIIGSICHKYICPAEERQCPITDLGQDVDGSERVLLTSNGERVPIIKTVSTVDLDGRRCLIESILDITEHKKAENVRRMDTLLREIHHRVKNNLQVISSLLYLQSKNFDDKEISSSFLESRDRVRSMAIAHQKLYQSTDIESIDVGDYVRNVANNLFQTYRIGSCAIKMELDVTTKVFMGIERVISLGLIINELITNSLKYAFQGRKTGVIDVKLHLDNGMFTLVVGDNGAGLPEDLDIESTRSLGLRLVNSLLDQLQGTLELDASSGTKFIIMFEQ